MKRKPLLVGLIGASLCLTIGFWLRLKPDGQRPVETTQSLIDEQRVPTNLLKVQTNDLLRNDSEVQRPADMDERTWLNAARMNERYRASNQEISLHGHIVDQDANPVRAARVELTVHRNKGDLLIWLVNSTNRDSKYYSPAIQEKVVMLSDESGNFSLTNKQGTRVDLESISKDGYLFLESASDWTRANQVVFRYGLDGDTNTSHRFPETPHRFFLWKRKTAEPLVWTSLVLSLDESEKSYVANLILSEGGQKPSAHFDLQATLVGQPSATDPARRFEAWNLVLEAKDGGLRPVTNEVSFLAPMEDYQPRLEFSSANPDVQRWVRNREQRRFYLQSRRGNVFAIIMVRVDMHRRDGGRLFIEAKVNPRGSPNLEPDPAKQITDPDEIRRLDVETSK